MPDETKQRNRDLWPIGENMCLDKNAQTVFILKYSEMKISFTRGGANLGFGHFMITGPL